MFSSIKSTYAFIIELTVERTERWGMICNKGPQSTMGVMLILRPPGHS